MQKFRIILCVTVQFLLCILLNLRAISEYKPAGVVDGRFIGGFCVTSFFFFWGGGGGLIFGGAYFQNFTVCLCLIRPCCLSMIFQIAGDFFSDSIDPIM